MVETAQLSTELGFVLFLSGFLSVLAFLMALLPQPLQFVSIFDVAWLGGGFIAVSSACVILSGIPCAVGMTVFGVLSIFSYLVVLNEVFKLLIFTPLVIGLIYVVSRLARGGG